MLEIAFKVSNLSYAYTKEKQILNNISLDIEKNKITTLIGPNGCGKTTLFNILSKTNKFYSGTVDFMQKPLMQYSKKEFALKVSVVHQYNIVPPDITVGQLVEMGRIPFKKSLIFSSTSKKDSYYIDRAMKITNIQNFSDIRVDELSGGQLQRVWLALALAQSTDVILLDEITTYLDIYYQLDILKLIRDLNNEFKTTVLMVLHDINHTLEFSDNVVILKSGVIKNIGKVNDTITEKSLKEVFNVDTQILNINSKQVCIYR